MSAGTFLASLPINPSLSHACCRRVAAHCRNIMLGELFDSSPVLLDYPQKAALGLSVLRPRCHQIPPGVNCRVLISRKIASLHPAQYNSWLVVVATTGSE